MPKWKFKNILVLHHIILSSSLYHVMAVKHDPPLQLFGGIVLTGEESSLTMTLRPVYASSWKLGRLPPTKESSAVSCANACARMNDRKQHSCNALSFTDASGECHLGTASVAAADIGEMELVYVLHGHSGEKVT